MSATTLGEKHTESTSSRTVRLRPGTLVRARGDGLIQVGSDPRRRALVPDTPGVRGLLHLLEPGLPFDAHDDLPVLASALRRAGVLVEPEVQHLMNEARAWTTVVVSAPPHLLPEVQDLLALAGLGRSTDGQPDAASAASSSSARSTQESSVLLRVGAGPELTGCDEPESERPTLDVTVIDSQVRVGPFAVPGRTACAGCVRAHQQEADPWAASVADFPGAHSSAADVPLVDPLLLHAALTSAVQDVAAWAEGRQPSTWSATRWFSPSQHSGTQVWEPHPHCGCRWAAEID